MNKIQIIQLTDKLKKLENFVLNKKSIKTNPIRRFFRGEEEVKKFNEQEILGWVAECVSFFSEVGVNSVVIDNFLKFFSLSCVEEKSDFVKRIGPFVATGYYNKIYEASSLVDFDFTKMAFKCAQGRINKLVEEERIIPRWLIDRLFTNEITKHLSSSLDSVENCYQRQDSDGVVANLITLLDGALNLDDELNAKGKEKISIKLNSLSENKEKLAKLGVTKEIVLALNALRIIRNEKVIHKDLPLKYDIPLLVASSFAYLVVFFLECLILNGEIFNNQSKD